MQQLFIGTKLFIAVLSLNDIELITLVVILFLALGLLALSVIISYVSHRRKLARFTVSSLKIGVIATNRHRRIFYVNPAMEDLTGYTFKELKRKNPRILSSGRHDSTFYHNMWNDIHNKGFWTGEMWDRRKDGTLYPKRISIYAIRGLFGIGLSYVSTHEDLSIVRKTEEQITFLRDYVPSTNLLNQNAMIQRMNALIDDKKPFSIIFLRVSNYSYLQITQSQEKYYRGIVSFIEHLATQMNMPSESFAQISDDALVIISPLSEISAITAFVEEIIRLEEREINFSNEESLLFTFKCGISRFPEDGANAVTLLTSAQIAATKINEDSNRDYIFYRPELSQKITEDEKIKEQLVNGIKNNEFELFYQPKVDIQNNIVVGAEGLLRWRSPTLGLVSPMRFIPVAERLGLMNDIGAFVIRKAVSDLVIINSIFNKRHLQFSVNTTASQYVQNRLYETLIDVLGKSHIDAKQLELEITESILIDDRAQMIAYLSKIRELGVTISLDDFGTGYSSLGYIRDMPIDTLKIDRSFIKDYPKDDDGKVAEAIISLAHLFNLKLVAEGAETLEQVEFLRGKQCQMVQGYYYAKPLQFADFIDFVKHFDSKK
ncbi:MAG: EAL domain-containing protein [Bacilli bacterium]|jgi:PAS domain S-box-containing protein|nr:EAL domain-containing protein [Bacilli bacterium]